ncbi:ladderlectin-like [Esox lucius]|uniref:C-type lectin domain-containing protein n=1 Tax=Esox lucius TaxID=8010 RepID=A0AAY5KRT3_ESOLU|nr:ladderlectin-like [Esox lucius]
MAIINILLLLCAAFILCESTPLLEANQDQLSASEPKLKTNGEHLPGVNYKEIIGEEGDSNEQSPGLKEINPVQALTQGNMNDMETLHPSEELNEVQALSLESFQAADERVELTQSRSSCPSGWYNYGSHCFRFINTAMSWAESEQFCVLQRGNLASIHNKDEDNFIKVLMRVQAGGLPVTWIGGYDLGKTSLWLWSDGSIFVYSNWGKGEPNNGFGNCLQINYGTDKLWDDTDCKTKLPFVCRKKK